MDLTTFRQQYPQYDDIPDHQLVARLHARFYSDMPLEQFTAAIGWQPQVQPGPPLARPAIQRPLAAGRPAPFSEPADPQAVADLAGQALGTGAGIAVGSFAGPPGAVAGGATGSVLGKRAARYLTGAPQPGIASAETLVDAASGAAGPAVNAVSRAAAAGVRRLIPAEHLTELSEAQRAMRRVDRETRRTAQRETNAAELAPGTEHHVRMSEQRMSAESMQALARDLYHERVDDIIKGLPKHLGLNAERSFYAALATFAGTGSPVHALVTFLGAPVVGSLGKTTAARLLKSRTFLDWALRREASGSAVQIHTSLKALLADASLSAQERTDIQELASSLQRERPPPQRDARTGRFNSPRGRTVIDGVDYTDHPIPHGSPLP